MSDAEDFIGAEPVQGEKDLVADFLMREQDQLAGLQDNFDQFGPDASKGTFYSEEFNAAQGYGVVTPTAGGEGFDAFATTTDPNDFSQNDDQYNAIKHHDKQRTEPEQIRKWREEQTERLLKKDAESEKKKAEWREAAKHELDDWYRHREEQLEKAMKVNREGEDAFVLERDEKKPGGEWERICRLCDFNPKSSRNTKDVSRMRSILLQLKQTPIERQ